MKTILAATLILLLVPGPSPLAQQAEHGEVAAKPQSTPDGAADSDETAAKPGPPPPPPLSDEERKIRDERIRVLQERVNDCHNNFMGLPVEHDECVKKVLLMADDPAPAGEAGIGDRDHE
jgi:hypothetical protein